jgi:hypothetical protein
MRMREVRTGIQWRILEKGHHDDLSIDEVIKLKWILKKWDGRVWTGLIWLTTVVNTVP